MANETHFIVGKKVRQKIKELSGKIPEDLLTSNKSLKELERIKLSNSKDDEL